MAAQQTYLRDCVLYLRKSKGKAGIARQRKESRAYAERLRWRIIAEFAEPDATAFAKIGEEDAPRPEFERMIAFLERDDREPALGIVAWHADRLSRNSSEVRPFIAVCVKGRHPVETPRCGGYDLSLPNNRKRFRDDISDAEGEVDHLIERVESQKAEAAAEGRWLGGPRPFGFKKDGVRHRKSEAAALVKAFADVRAGTSLNAIAREWNEAGIESTGRAAEWTASAVRLVLLRPRNAGLMVWRGQITGKASWEPIVSESEWRAVARVLEDPNRRTSPGPGRRWLGSGIYLCGVCGKANLTVHTGTAQPRRKRYRCGPGQHVTRDALQLDAYVVEHVVALLSRADAGELLVNEDGPERAKAEARLLELRAELTEAEAVAPSSVYEARKLGQLAASLAGDIAELEATLIRPDRAAILRDLIEADDVGAKWLETPLDRQRAVLRELVVVTVNPAPRGRPPGRRRGDEPFFHSESIDVVPV